MKNGKVTNVLQVAPPLKKSNVYELLGWVPSVSQMKVQNSFAPVHGQSLTFK